MLVWGRTHFVRPAEAERGMPGDSDPSRHCHCQPCSHRNRGRGRPGLSTNPKLREHDQFRGYYIFFATFPSRHNRTGMHKVNLAEKFSKVSEYWKPYVAAELNGQSVKLDKIKGEFIFHHHEHEDELFLVVKGRFRMEFKDRPHEWVEEGEFIVVPRGVEHKPVAEEECWFLLFEPSSTLNTGNVVNERTHRELERV
jgi:mannose-6-phosphate isomerase-like protein (cupin superfamily)